MCNIEELNNELEDFKTSYLEKLRIFKNILQYSKNYKKISE